MTLNNFAAKFLSLAFSFGKKFLTYIWIRHGSDITRTWEIDVVGGGEYEHVYICIRYSVGVWSLRYIRWRVLREILKINRRYLSGIAVILPRCLLAFFINTSRFPFKRNNEKSIIIFFFKFRGTTVFIRNSLLNKTYSSFKKKTKKNGLLELRIRKLMYEIVKIQFWRNCRVPVVDYYVRCNRFEEITNPL